MKIKGNTLYVKSEDNFYLLERAGDKPNTTRILPRADYSRLVRANPNTIPVELASSNGHSYFEREIKNISEIGELFGKVFATISWKYWEEAQE